VLGIIALILIAIVAVSILSFAAHILFSPLVLIIVGILLWMKLRPRRSHQ
jgi:threonine/homoserine/homoserine lactone efflux protein